MRVREGLAAGVASVALLAGCGSAAHSASRHRLSSDRRIVADFVADEHAVEKVLLAWPAANPNDPRLLAHTAGPRLVGLRALITDITNAGDVSEGHLGVGNPRVISISKDGKTAVVATCEVGDLLTTTPLGQPVPGVLGTPAMDGLRATLKLIHGQWLEWRGTGKGFPYNGGHGKCPGF